MDSLDCMGSKEVQELDIVGQASQRKFAMLLVIPHLITHEDLGLAVSEP
jgi:hypothetical protein